MQIGFYTLLVLGLLLLSHIGLAQTTTFTADPGRWTDAVNWSNGLPNSTTDAIIDGRCRTPLGGGTCKNLDILAGWRIAIGDGFIINVLGELNLEPTATIVYNGGTLQVADDISLNNVRKIEVGGTIQFVSNFDIGQ